MSKANAEQLLAIQHEGGVLLRAGAGSGKTFVLVEHIIYLTSKWIIEFKVTQGMSFEEYIRQKFSQVVMMTFTKKAAGEMSIRLTDKFAEMSTNTEDDIDLWHMANEALPLLTVTTIDGFCRKLITGGYFPNLSTEAKIIFTPERLDQVQEMLDRWFKEKSGTIPPDILDIVIREKKALLSAFGNVFSDPGLRLAWKKFSISETHPRTLGKLLEQSFALNDLASSLHAIGELELPSETERSAFEKVVGQFQSLGLPEVDNVEKLEIYAKFFEPIKVLRGESGKKKSPAHEAAKDGLSAMRDWVREWSSVTGDYTAHYETKVLPWMTLCQELFHWFEDRLDPNQGMTFGDIEYFVSLGLENKDYRERIQKVFQYFIVDEFQDTSALQFRIIQGLIGSDYNRLFCVGDAKQAIYGFRGGELSVFRDCAELVPSVRSLANNYRSLPEIINFNNSLFQAILPLGQEFTGHDPFSVEPEDQHVPEMVEVLEAGEIDIITALVERDLEVEGKFSTEEINRLEAHLIADSISAARIKKPGEVCTVLYSKLKPSGELIRALMDRKIGFTAQFKIDLLDDPIMGIFLCLLKRQFDSNEQTHDKYPLFIIRSYLNVLGVSKEIGETDLAEFDLNVKYWGLTEGFRKFFFKLHVTNENSDINLHVIETFAAIFHQDPESIMVQITDGENQRMSLDLRSGENAHMVQIMTAHSSKGLEFDTVYLGGIYTNGKEMSDGSMFGDLPGSFTWYQDLGLRDKKKSPFYVYENELSKYKNFSESKRLFYVACTRAKKHLVWVDLQLPEKSFSIPKNSWIDGLRAWFDRGLSANCSKSVQVKTASDFNSRELLNSKSMPQLPLFFHDSVGIHPKGDEQGDLALVAELSVTRLNSLLDCPRKFYLENILKLSSDSKVFYESFVGDEVEELAQVITSSADRGTMIHAQIAKGIERNFVVPRESFSTPARKPIEWALNLLRDQTASFEFVAEKQIKFKFFNFMIAGIPDLILFPKGEGKTQVWDFKTGKITQDNLSHYWLQLSIYAYALYELERVKKADQIDLVLCFVDEERVITESITWEKCRTDLYPIWRSQNEPWTTNLDHCSQCTYKDICPR
ncbi:MAG TPA: UvrD-helicase domain-containing protein [Bacteriovoracaceae bacterium]|nr:UvrD-helicase domain-containing protein [Bacteriovoracaceae bacterium]